MGPLGDSEVMKVDFSWVGSVLLFKCPRELSYTINCVMPHIITVKDSKLGSRIPAPKKNTNLPVPWTGLPSLQSSLLFELSELPHRDIFFLFLLVYAGWTKIASLAVGQYQLH